MLDAETSIGQRKYDVGKNGVLLLDTKYIDKEWKQFWTQKKQGDTD